MPSEQNTDDHRLPPTALPHHYELSLAPDLVTATFTGEVAISLEVPEPTDRLVCNAAELEIGVAWVVVAGARVEATVRVDEDAERVEVVPERTLPATDEAVLHVRFRGVLNDKLRGFYRSTFTDESGATRTVAVTQFEATDARRAFPCWDEPAYKATFGIQLEVADDLLAVSNGPEIERTSTGRGTARIRFADTMKMSTYLVAFVVGPLETSRTVDVDGVPLRIVFRPGQRHLAELALEAGAFALRYFTDYYGIVYPGDKMDMVAVPDFAFGAMENLGCVIYRENLLLVDPETATRSELQAVVDVIAHELAHMWFGDLVTMDWWNGIWLNEAFATFMEMKCTDAFRPEWRRWMDFGRERSGAFEVDALATTRPVEYPVHSPTDAEAMFDVLTYQKGSAVVRMLEQYLGEDAFRDGIHRYLQTHQFANTATADLWRALEAETGEPVEALMDTWIFQGGFPLVHADLADDDLELRQERFQYLGRAEAATWHVPVVVREPGGATERMVLDRASDTVAGFPAVGPVVVNAGGHAFYRVAYSADLQERIDGSLGSLEPLERYAILDDRLALTLRGDVHGADLARLVARLVEVGEDDLSVWQLAAKALDVLHRAVGAGDRDAFSSWARHAIAPTLDLLGPTAREGEDERRRALRGLLRGVAGQHGDTDVLAQLRQVLSRSWSTDGGVDPDLAAGALRAVATHADGDDFDHILDRFRNAATLQEQYRHLYAAALVRDVDLFDRYLELLAGSEVRSQNLGLAGAHALRNAVHADRAWAWVRDDWARLQERLPFNAANRLFEGIAPVTDPDLADDIERFVSSTALPGADRRIAQSVERMRVHVALHDREAGRLMGELP